jgi:deacetoxycephalosporin-C synthase/deacetoxycephalosporin-C hydroxylase
VTSVGLFYLTDCGMSEEDHRPARDVAMELFEHASPEVHRALRAKHAGLRRGYSGLGAESTAIVTNTGEYSDYSMSFSMGSSGNQFPSQRFEAIWTDYFVRLYELARETARRVISSTGKFDDDMDALLDCDPLLRLRYFPEVPPDRVAEVEPLRMAPHYDPSIVTLIHQTPCSNGFVSLQAHIAGETVDLPAVPDAVVVVCGAVATLVTQGVIHAPRHHVAAPPAVLQSGSDRTSSVFFLRPRHTFTFSVKKAREYGLDVTLGTEMATFGEWIGSNYVAMHTEADARVR